MNHHLVAEARAVLLGCALLVGAESAFAQQPGLTRGRWIGGGVGVGWSDQLQGVVANDLGFVAQLRGGAGERHVVGDEQQRSPLLDPAPYGLDLVGGERRTRRQRLGRRAGVASGVGDNGYVDVLQPIERERRRPVHDAVAVAPQEIRKAGIATTGGVEVEVCLVDGDDGALTLPVGRIPNDGVKVGVGALLGGP